jgi:hypothetical protein
MAPASRMRWWLPVMRSGGRHEPAGLAGRGDAQDLGDAEPPGGDQ